MAKKHLGRGLSALLGGDPAVAAATAPHAGEAAAAAVAGQRQVAIELLHPGRYQPRGHFNTQALEDLAQSIRSKGVLQPILVRAHPSRPKGEFEIIAGERRWRAAQLAQLHEVPVVEKQLTDRDALEIALIENIQRQDLNPLEEAEGYHRLMQEFGYTQEELAERLGKSRSALANSLRLRELPGQVRSMLVDGRLSVGHARALLTCADPVAVANEVVAQGLNVRQTEKLARDFKPGALLKSTKAKKAPKEKDADTKALERDLALKLGLRVEIDFDGKGGKVTLHYKTLAQLDGLIAKLG
ncbi:ParB family chromosome partitioning protein [Dongia mobilis]|uniref:ParB family chromosome partitioning protein n=1 Tax=Dongia mobilis TaxID=578943 RepID=A0A4R6WLW8_9PROT|nr:ParB/RepB/Spo0J family partition protein [Dongia mobilis]TDQ81969.1 ParB family chromosome partitioning protein [Dongia mobilis]